MHKLLGKILPRHHGARNNAWRYALASDYGYHSEHLQDIAFANDWVIIKDGDIAIKAGYAWDGCSPCISVFGLFYIGTPDGAQHLGVPATYHASLVHDALCQWRGQIPIPRRAAVALFRQMLDDVQFPLAGLYALMVGCIGPRDFVVDQKF